jgi:hypothetical protein
LKCDPGLAEVLRQTFDAVKPGYHGQTSLEHDHARRVGARPPGDRVDEHSYGLVLASLTRVRAESVSADCGRVWAGCGKPRGPLALLTSACLHQHLR